MAAPLPAKTTAEAGNGFAHSLSVCVVDLVRHPRPEKKNRRGGSRNPLKRLISDKEIKGNPSLFLCRIWLELGQAWLDFAEFGVSFENRAGVRLRGRPPRRRYGLRPRPKHAALEWRTLDSIPTSALEARPRGVPAREPFENHDRRPAKVRHPSQAESR
jgi:hypothetical protein